MDDRRPADDGLLHRPRRGRDHHRLPGSAPDGHGAERPASAKGVPRALGRLLDRKPRTPPGLEAAGNLRGAVAPRRLGTDRMLAEVDRALALGLAYVPYE